MTTPGFTLRPYDPTSTLWHALTVPILTLDCTVSFVRPHCITPAFCISISISISTFIFNFNRFANLVAVQQGSRFSMDLLRCDVHLLRNAG
jgi:hypothetical protein